MSSFSSGSKSSNPPLPCLYFKNSELASLFSKIVEKLKEDASKEAAASKGGANARALSMAPLPGFSDDASELVTQLSDPTNVNAKNLFKEITGLDVDNPDKSKFENYVNSSKPYDWDGNGVTDYVDQYKVTGLDAAQRAARCVAEFNMLYSFRQLITNSENAPLKTKLLQITGYDFGDLKFKMQERTDPQDSAKKISDYMYEYLLMMMYHYDNGTALQPREPATIIVFLKRLTDLYNAAQADPTVRQLLIQVLGVDFVDGVSLKELGILGTKDLSIFYDAQGNLLDIKTAINNSDPVLKLWSAFLKMSRKSGGMPGFSGILAMASP